MSRHDTSRPDSDDHRSEVARHLDRLWESANDPLLVASLRVEHALTKAREEVEVVIAAGGTTVRHRASHALLPARQERTVHPRLTPHYLASRLRALGILELGSTDQKMYDGAVAEVAARDADRSHTFHERSVEGPQAEVRKFLLRLAHESESPDADSPGRPDSSPPDTEMSFIVTTPKSTPPADDRP